MKRSAAASVVITFLLASFPASGDVSVGSQGDRQVNIEGQFKSEARSKQELVKNGVPFMVATKIENISAEERTLHIWLCSFNENWVTNNSAVKIAGIECTRNFVMEINLKPHEAYERELSVSAVAMSASASSNNASDTVSFRLGFVDGSNYDYAADDPRRPRPVWSNAIAVKIRD